MDDDELPLTQTPDYLGSQNSQDLSQGNDEVGPWGRLSPMIDNLPSIDLYNQTYKVGRSPQCDIVLKDCEAIPVLNISKVHFCLTKDENIVVLTDLSKNGTFINRAKVGRNQKQILSTADTISLGQPKDKVYTFHSNILNGGDKYLSKELLKTYYISALLGKGACGEVRLAYNKRTFEKFAVKQIIKGRSSVSTAIINHPNKIKTEIEILTSLTHPFIIQMKEVFEIEREVFIVLEYLRGGELTNRIMTLARPFPENEVKFIFYQILLGIKYLHSNGISHRDIKAENILMTTDGNYPVIKISDFGLSKIMDEFSLMNTTCGTLAYVAPEVISMRESYGKKIDVWSLGVLLFFMLSRSLPFAGSDRETIARKVIAGRVSWEHKGCKTMSSAVKDLIRCMLTVNDIRRISVDEIMTHSWVNSDPSMLSKIQQLLGGDDVFDP